MFKIRYVFLSRSTSQLGPATYQVLNSPVWPAGGHLPGQRRSNVSRPALSRYPAQVPYWISKHWGTGKTPERWWIPQPGRRRKLSGPAGTSRLDHTPAMTVPNRAFALMRTDRSPFLKGGERNLKPGSLRIPNKDRKPFAARPSWAPRAKEMGEGGG